MLSAIHASVFSGPMLIYPFISCCMLVQFPIYILPRLKGAALFVKIKKAKMERWMELKKARKRGIVTSINPTEETLLHKDDKKTDEEE
jgi:hypothetical protein